MTSIAQRRARSRCSVRWLMGAPEKLLGKTALAIIVVPPKTGVTIAPATLAEQTTMDATALEEIRALATAGDREDPMVTLTTMSHHAKNHLSEFRCVCHRKLSSE